MCVFLYIYTHQQLINKGFTNFKGSQEVCMGGFGERKENGAMIYYNLKNKRKIMKKKR